MQPEAFAAARREQLLLADERLGPAVESGLMRYLNGEDGWASIIRDTAGQIWLEHYVAESPGRDYDRALARFREAVGEALSRTSQPTGDVTQAQIGRIVRWLSTYSVNAGTIAGAYGRGIRFKRWTTMNDADVREIHEHLDGQIRPIGGTFDVAGHRLPYPAVPVGPPEVWIECRCVAQPASREGGAMSANTFTIGPEYEIDEEHEIVSNNITAAADLANPDGTPYTGALVVLVPADSDPVVAASSEPAHLTTIWFGDLAEMESRDTPEFPQIDLDTLHQEVRQYASDLDGPVVVPVRERGTLGEDDADVVFLEPTDSLMALRDGLLTNEQIGSAYNAVEQYPEWTPHVTLGYPDRPAKGEYDATEVTFDRISLWLGGEHYDYPMGGTAVTAAAEFTDEEKAANVSLGDDGRWRRPDGSPATDREAAFAIWGMTADAAVDEDVAADEPTVDEVDDDEEFDSLIPIHGVLAPEEILSGDSRGFRKNAVTTRKLPLHYRYEFVGSHGGNQTSQAVTVGTLTEVWRHTDGMNRFRGYIDMNRPYADQALADILQGIGFNSIDADAMEQDVSMYFDADGNMVEPEAPTAENAGKQPETWYSKVRVAGLTQVPIQAFPETYTALGHEFEEDMTEEQLVAAAAILEDCGCSDTIDLSEDVTGFATGGIVEAGKMALVGEQGPEAVIPLRTFRDVSTDERKRLAEGDKAMPDGSYPIANVEDLKNAIQSIGRASNPDAVKAHIKKRARALGHPELIPEDWASHGGTFAPGTKDGPGWVTNPKATKRIRDYWTRGEGAAKIGWGTPGDFNRCRAQLAKYVQNPEWLAGLCANMHYEVLKTWPGPKRGDKGRHGLAASGDTQRDSITLVASAHTVYQSSSFREPTEPRAFPMRINRETREIQGYAAQWGVCHIGIQGMCQEPPKSSTNYSYFRKGIVETDAGEQSVGLITFGIGHAGDRMSAAAATAHYDQTDAVKAYINIGENAYGIWYSGVLAPWVTDEDIDAMLAIRRVSGDWRNWSGRYGDLEMVGLVCVNTEGFQLAASAALDGMVGGVQTVAIGIGAVPIEDEVLTASAAGETHEEFVQRLAVEVARVTAFKAREQAARERIYALRVADARARLERI